MKIYQEKIKLVLAALEISEFTWRTARGLASETGLDESLVHEILLSDHDAIQISSTNNKNGEQLFALQSDRQNKSKVLNRPSVALNLSEGEKPDTDQRGTKLRGFNLINLVAKACVGVISH